MNMQEFDAIRDKLLYAQRRCAWCQEHFSSAELLAEHIIHNHRSRPPMVGSPLKILRENKS